MAISIQNDVIWLEVSEYNTFGVKLFKTKKDFSSIKLRFVLIKSLFKLYVL
jgi:hypothetical protein